MQGSADGLVPKASVGRQGRWREQCGTAEGQTTSPMEPGRCGASSGLLGLGGFWVEE